MMELELHAARSLPRTRRITGQVTVRVSAFPPNCPSRLRTFWVLLFSKPVAPG